MGSVFSYQNASKDTRQKRKLKCNHNKYLKPDDGMVDCVLQSNVIVQTSSIGFPMRVSSPISGHADANHFNFHLKTPKTPFVKNPSSDSVLESLPMDILVKVVCHLHHDQLKPVFHVSQRLREAVILARQFHFNYKTPDRSRQGLLRLHTPNSTEHRPFKGKGNAKSVRISSPRTPKAPKRGPRPPSRLKYTDMRQIAVVLFQEAPLPSRYMVPSVLQRPPRKSLASH
uniref:F-box domain-containing protein n=1 Tax=Kalanchoe fedtschenkoi TaxID=63787 RepID=A0A7N0ZWL8_KALFE